MTKKNKDYFDFDFDFDFNIDKDQKHKNPNPLDVIEYENNIEKDSRKELNVFQKKFKESRENEKNQLKLRMDTEYWFCVCFSSREQKDDFLKKMNLYDLSDKYLDGYKVAERLNIDLVEVNLDNIAKVKKK